jgi:YD repeat-containing protein
VDTEILVYSVKDALPEDFEHAVDESRLRLSERRRMQGEREVCCELFNEEGAIISRTETKYDERSNVTEIREFAEDNFSVPFKRQVNSYSEKGQPLSEQSYFDAELNTTVTFVYDPQGRLIRQTTIHEEEKTDVLYDYENGITGSVKESYFGPDGCSKVITNKYSIIAGKEIVTEEYIENKINGYDSRVFRYYTYGSRPHGVIWEEYNVKGDFLQECRERRDVNGNVLSRGLYLNEYEDTAPYHEELYYFDFMGNCIAEQITEKGHVFSLKKREFDTWKRKVKEFSEAGSDSTVLILRYRNI